MAYNRDANEYEGFLYIILNDIYPEEIYIGQTTQTIEKRWQGHRRQMKKHSSTDRLHNLMNKYGIEHFAVEGLEKCVSSTKEELIKRLDEKEIYYINRFDSYHNGLNLTNGGRNASEHQMRPVTQYSLFGEKIDEYESIEYLKKYFYSVSVIYSCCMGKSKYAHGYVWRYKEDDLLKYPLPNESEISQAINRTKTNQPICKYDCYGNIVSLYKNIDEAAKENNVDKKKIYKCCMGDTIYVDTYVYRFKEDSFYKYKYYSDKPKLVEKRTLDGDLICIFKSAREAGKSIGRSGSQISLVCLNKGKSAGGFIWRYVEDPKREEVVDFKHNYRCKKVYQYNNTFDLIAVFLSIKDASEATGISCSTIARNARGKTKKTRKNYIWSFTSLNIE